MDTNEQTLRPEIIKGLHILSRATLERAFAEQDDSFFAKRDDVFETICEAAGFDSDDVFNKYEQLRSNNSNGVRRFKAEIKVISAVRDKKIRTQVENISKINRIELWHGKKYVGWTRTAKEMANALEISTKHVYSFIASGKTDTFGFTFRQKLATGKSHRGKKIVCERKGFDTVHAESAVQAMQITHTTRRAIYGSLSSGRATKTGWTFKYE
ncbi:MAG: hypothetical protein M0P29_12880 [Sphaerochaetaceae bacterium]|jgi:hypothetical protein|nr:hypothetical protein [Sphaerochaetaceae bacterium]